MASGSQSCSRGDGRKICAIGPGAEDYAGQLGGGGVKTIPTSNASAQEGGTAALQRITPLTISKQDQGIRKCFVLHYPICLYRRVTGNQW